MEKVVRSQIFATDRQSLVNGLAEIQKVVSCLVRLGSVSSSVVRLVNLGMLFRCGEFGGD